jgi:hypothetical protein
MKTKALALSCDRRAQSNQCVENWLPFVDSYRTFLGNLIVDCIELFNAFARQVGSRKRVKV